MKDSVVIWITGLAGSGKTTIANQLALELKKRKSNVIMLDGDELRLAIGHGVGYSLEERRKLSFQYAGLCKLLAQQGFTVIWSGIAMFDEVRNWNKENIANYYEVYLKVPMDILVARNKNNLYESIQKNSNVVGVGIQMEEPKFPNLVIENGGTLTPQESARLILNDFFKWENERAAIIN